MKRYIKGVAMPYDKRRGKERVIAPENKAVDALKNRGEFRLKTPAEMSTLPARAQYPEEFACNLYIDHIF